MEVIEPHIHGCVNFKSSLPIEDIGKIIGDEIFSGAVFGGREKHIYEEIPAMYIDNLMLGFLFVIQGYPGFDNGNGYSLNMTPYFSIRNKIGFNVEKFQEVNLDIYLFVLLSERLKSYPEIQIIKPEIPQN